MVQVVETFLAPKTDELYTSYYSSLSSTLLTPGSLSFTLHTMYLYRLLITTFHHTTQRTYRPYP